MPPEGHRICKLALGKRWEPAYRRLCFGRETRQLLLQKTDSLQKSKPAVVDTPDACKLWIQGLQHLMEESCTASHPLLVERWLRKEFYAVANPSTLMVSVKHMKPFVQGRLQCKIQSRHLQELVEEHMAYEAFANAYRRLIHVHSLFSDRFAAYSDDGYRVDFMKFLRFLLIDQKDDLGSRKDVASEFLRRYLKDVDVSRDTTEPFLSVQEFVDFLFSRENSVWDPVQDEVCQTMDLPLSSYWIASSHNTYLTGDQLKSESSLDAYARALQMGCRCIELDCWPGQKKGSEADVIIYHGYTITTKLALRDVLMTIREYAFATSEFPLILSIEDNCTVEYQRIMAKDFSECLGDLLLTEPVDWNETCLPSPNMLRRKIILKHKKLPAENDKPLSSAVSLTALDDSLADQDLMSKTDFVKKGVLQMRDEFGDDFTPSGLRPDEMHITEEWFHGKLSREEAVRLLNENRALGDGLFLIRESNTFVGDFSLSFYYNRDVHHCRIKTKMMEGEKRYYFLDTKVVDTLYELITYYMENALNTPNFKTQLLTPCPQPQPHLNEPWFAGDIGKSKAEEMLNAYREDGAFLIRYSTGDESVFVLSIRVDGEIFHYRLKRDGRLFLVNQTIFENLNMFVKYYQEHELVRGICLKYPVNAESIGTINKLRDSFSQVKVHPVSDAPSTSSVCVSGACCTAL